MALAIIEFILFDKNQARFTIDTGTNSYYRLRIGKAVTDAGGIRLVDEITHSTAVQRRSNAGELLATSHEIALPAAYFDRESCYVQLFSFKTPDGRSPAFSEIIKVPVGLKTMAKVGSLFSLSKTSNGMVSSTEFNDCRRVDQEPVSQQQSAGDILNVLKALAPGVLQLLTGTQNGPAANTPDTAHAGFINSLLQALLHGFSTSASLNGACESGHQNSFTQSAGDSNRFMALRDDQLSRPFIFGIDDALLATLAGPLLQQGVQMLPQLLSSVEQQKIQKQAANNKLITDILTETNKRLLLSQLLQNQEQAANAQNANNNQLMQLMQQAAAAKADAAPATPAAAATGQSLPQSAMAFSLSAGATLVFDTGTPINWNGGKKAVYSRNGPIQCMLRLNTPAPAPEKPLAKAIISFYFREAGSTKNLLEKTFKQKNIAANTPLGFAFTKEEIAGLPLNKNMVLYAEMRWLTASEKQVKALGSAELVFADNYFVKEQGKAVSDERELRDMKVYRAFWNKIWEAPVLDTAQPGRKDAKKYSWEVNLNCKYGFTLTADHDSNGLQETKILKAAADPDSLTDTTEGRVKAGIELSIPELNKLATLWDKQAVLPEDKLAAVNNGFFAAGNAAEFVYNIKMKGKAGQRGMVWVIPVLKLFSITLSKIKTTNASGQVVETSDEIIQFPLPVAGRAIGLKSA